MATEPEEREDLLNEATGLPQRGQFFCNEMPIVVGFRADASASWYFDGDPVFQFDSAMLMRRLFMDGQKFAIVKSQIVRLSQKSSGGRMQFDRIPLQECELSDLQKRWEALIAPVRLLFENKAVVWDGTSIDEATLENKVANWLREVPHELAFARTSRSHKKSQ